MKNKKSHLPFGILASLIIIILSVIFHISGVEPQSPVMYAGHVVFLIAVIWSCINYSKINDGYVTFGNVFANGFKTSAVVAVFMAVWGFVMFSVFPEMKEQMLEMMQENMAKNPSLSDEQIEKTMSMMEKSLTLTTVGSMIFGFLLMGAIFSLIGAAVAKKKGERPPHLDVS